MLIQQNVIVADDEENMTLIHSPFQSDQPEHGNLEHDFRFMDGRAFVPAWQNST
jgi:hypothetical protein